jgi:hypothetical protein
MIANKDKRVAVAVGVIVGVVVALGMGVAVGSGVEVGCTLAQATKIARIRRETILTCSVFGVMETVS